MRERRAKKIYTDNGNEYYVLQKKVLGIWISVSKTGSEWTTAEFLNPTPKKAPEYMYPKKEISQ